jgi:hypothetical protein
MAGGRRLPPSIERLWLGELRRAHAIINIISIYLYSYIISLFRLMARHGRVCATLRRRWQHCALATAVPVYRRWRGSACAIRGAGGDGKQRRPRATGSKSK